MANGDPILDLSDLINLATGGNGGAPEQINFHKHHLIAGAAPSAPIAGRLVSLWRYEGQPSLGAAPTTAAVCTNATAGSFAQTTPTAGKRKRLIGAIATSLVAGSLILYDRLSHQGGLSGTTTGAQTTNLPTAALTRHTTGAGVQLWAEIYTSVGATATTITASYTDQGGTAGNATPTTTFGGTGFNLAQRAIVLPLASGDTGVRAVASVTIAASTLTAGAFGVTLAYPLVVIPIPAPGMSTLWSSMLLPGGPLDLGVTSDACIAMAWYPNTTTVPQIFGQAFFVEK